MLYPLIKVGVKGSENYASILFGHLIFTLPMYDFLISTLFYYYLGYFYIDYIIRIYVFYY
jgi:hypothetical protein